MAIERKGREEMENVKEKGRQRKKDTGRNT